MFMLYSIFSQCLLLQVLAKGAWAEKDLCVFRELDFRCNKTFGILVHFVFSILYFTHKSNLWYSHTYMRERTLCLLLFILLISFQTRSCSRLNSRVSLVDVLQDLVFCALCLLIQSYGSTCEHLPASNYPFYPGKPDEPPENHKKDLKL